MRKIAATYIYIQPSSLLKNSILVLEDDGTILEIIDTQGKLKEQAGLEHYSGMFVPGFIQPIFEELKTKQQHNKATDFSDLIKMNGFKVGSKPGVCLITSMDLSNLRLLPISKIKQIA